MSKPLISTATWFWTLFAVCPLVWSLPAAGQLSGRKLQAIERAGVEERLGAQLAAGLQFTDASGRAITLGSLVDRGIPTLLSLNYSDCPMLCQLQLTGLVNALRELPWNPGEEYQVIVVSIDPTETPQRAYLTKRKYLQMYGRPATAGGWHFLTGTQENIVALADAVGFRYEYLPESEEYSHAAVTMVVTPDGRLSRYLYGIEFPSSTVRMALTEASRGDIGSTWDRILLYCFHYDAAKGRYAPAAQRLMQVGAGLVLCALAAGLLPAWKRSRVGVSEPSTVHNNSSSPAMILTVPMLMGSQVAGLFPRNASTVASQVDWLFYVILGISIFFFAVIVIVMGLFVWNYRAPPGGVPAQTPSHNNALEATWTIIPGIIVGLIFYWGFVTFLEMKQPPDNSYEVQVVAKKWSWSFIYPNGHVDNNLHVPVDRPIRLVMSSDDVIHSLFVPAFRIKTDLIPGRYTRTWFQSHTPGEYVLFCAEYCGSQHSTMLAKVVVHPSGEFERWLQDAASFMDRLTPVEAGQMLYQRRGCAQCHSVDGSAKVGPTFANVFGTSQTMLDGEAVTVDENYLRESILEPQARIRAGYRGVMPTYQGQLGEEEIAALIAYIKSLSSEENGL